jgi:hypothetical protein
MAASSKTYGVIVMGGDLGGTLLPKDGHSVLILEKAKSPRGDAGELLLPFCYPLFEQLGLGRIRQ